MKHAPSDMISSPSSTRLVPVHAPRTLVGKVSRQGPFLLQPAPLDLKDSPGGDATDIAYLTLGSAFADDDDEASVSSERLGVVVIGYQDGRVDVCLDVEKIEARWDVRRVSLAQCFQDERTHISLRVSSLPRTIYQCLPFMKS